MVSSWFAVMVCRSGRPSPPLAPFCRRHVLRQFDDDLPYAARPAVEEAGQLAACNRMMPPAPPMSACSPPVIGNGSVPVTKSKMAAPRMLG